MKRFKRAWIAAGASALALGLVTAGCGELEASEEESPEVAAIAEALELDNGGLTMEDELAMFGAEEEFLAADLMEVELPNTDVMGEEPEVAAMMAAPDAVLFHTTVLWGQIPGDLFNTVPYNWSGTLSVNRGAMLVNSVIRFEGPTDNLLPRSDPRVVAFTSVTLPHNDGLRVTIVDPQPLAADPLVLRYEAQNGLVIELPVVTLLDGPQGQLVDGAGNRIVAVAMPQPIDICDNGFLGGVWHRVAEGRGRILGHVVNATGELIGHVRGIYGVRRNGEQVFFGKYINLAGQFRGIFAGHYAAGHFEGRWLHASGDVGELGGEYRETVPGPEVGGHFLGRWAETSCNLVICPNM